MSDKDKAAAPAHAASRARRRRARGPAVGARERHSSRSTARAREEIGVARGARRAARRVRVAEVALGRPTASSPARRPRSSARSTGGPEADAQAAAPFERGLGGAPTLVQNVETLAHLALVARFGAAWFRALGTRDEPGTALVTVSGAVAPARASTRSRSARWRRSSHRRAGCGEPGACSSAATSAAGSAGRRMAALLDADLAQAAGARRGRDRRLPARACGLAESARVVRYLAEESAGQCGPCVHGLARDRRRARAPRRAATATRAAGRAALDAQVRGRGACRHPDGAVRFVESALECSPVDVELHLARSLQRQARRVPPVPGANA